MIDTFFLTVYLINYEFLSQSRHFGYIMSPGNQGVFMLLKDVTFWGILAFFYARKWAYFGGICLWFGAHHAL